jgi:hypothetical protein
MEAGQLRGTFCCPHCYSVPSAPRTLARPSVSIRCSPLNMTFHHRADAPLECVDQCVHPHGSRTKHAPAQARRRERVRLSCSHDVQPRRAASPVFCTAPQRNWGKSASPPKEVIAHGDEWAKATPNTLSELLTGSSFKFVWIQVSVEHIVCEDV